MRARSVIVRLLPLKWVVFMRLFLSLLLSWFAVISSPATRAQSMPPIPMPDQPIACTDVETNAAALPAGVSTEDAWRGQDARLYVDLILRNAPTPTSGPLLFNARMLNKPTIFERTANQLIPTLAIACYPTTANNPRPDYVLPNGERVPHMQRPGETPLFADASKRYPTLVLAHGLGGAPLDADYLRIIKGFAQHGYVVVAAFHADQRFMKSRIGSFGDAIDIVRDYPLIAEAMAIRPVAVSELLHYFLNHAAFKDHLHPTAIAGWGASLGGQTLMLNQGARLTTSLGLLADGEVVITDKRIKAIVGYVPYSGIDYGSLASVATFDSRNEGVRGVRTPYMAITGTEDTTAPELQTERMIRNLSGSRYHISISGLGHTFLAPHAPDVFTWSLLFFQAHLHNDVAARERLASLKSIEGGAQERVVTSVTYPWWYQDETPVVEYFHAGIKHYFMTAIAGEIASLDQNPAWGWARTGEQFIAWRESASKTGAPLFRFYHDARGVGFNTHFFTLNAAEAAGLRPLTRDWAEEISQWRAFAPIVSGCPPFTIPITRAYNNRFAFNDSNHRFMGTAALANTMKSQNWVIEGSALCAAQP